MDLDTVNETLKCCELNTPAQRPWLLFDAGQAQTIRRRAQASIVPDDSGGTRPLLDKVRDDCNAILTREPEDPFPLQTYQDSYKMVTVAEGYFLLGDRVYADWVNKQIEQVCGIASWMNPALGTSTGPDSHAEHVMTNITANLAMAHDLLGDARNEADKAALADAIRNHCILPFIFSTKTRAAWWAWEDWKTNWKIMCCGEAGLAVCAFADHIPEAREALWLAARGVMETFDAVPPEGDWEEGVTYWFTTLYMGLRFATALRRLSGGAVDLFQHEALGVTGDFAVMTTTPGGRVYNFNDNMDRLPPYSADALVLLAKEKGREDWLQTARMFASHSVQWLAAENPDLHTDVPQRTAVRFPWTGIATARTGWGPDDTFIAVKATRTKMSHGHLDANSFVLESRGVPLLIDSGTWPYAFSLGNHDETGPRWNFDAFASVGHNTLLIDGQGQSCGDAFVARIVSLDSGNGWHRIVADASDVYPGLLKRFVRTIHLVAPASVIVHDEIVCDGERHVEWLMHYAGTVRTKGHVSIVENEGVRLVVTPLLPDRSMGWRVNDVTRTSTYVNDESGKQANPSIRYRSFSPFRAAEKFEFLFAMRVGEDHVDGEWDFRHKDGGWELQHGGVRIAPEPLPTVEDE